MNPHGCAILQSMQFSSCTRQIFCHHFSSLKLARINYFLYLCSQIRIKKRIWKNTILKNWKFRKNMVIFWAYPKWGSYYNKRQQAIDADSHAMDTLRRRAGVIGFRAGMLCYLLENRKFTPPYLFFPELWEDRVLQAHSSHTIMIGIIQAPSSKSGIDIKSQLQYMVGTSLLFLLPIGREHTYPPEASYGAHVYNLQENDQ